MSALFGSGGKPSILPWPMECEQRDENPSGRLYEPVCRFGQVFFLLRNYESR